VKVKLEANAGAGKINAIVTLEDGPGGVPVAVPGVNQ
jgi:hypothetical protein